MGNPELSADDIINAAAHYYNIEPRLITGPYQHKRIVLARHTAIHLMRDMTDLTYTEIANAVGGQHHSTAMMARKKVAAMLDPTNPDYQDLMRERVERVAVTAQKLQLQRNENSK